MKYNLLLPLLLAGTAGRCGGAAAQRAPLNRNSKGGITPITLGNPNRAPVVSDIVYGGNFRYRMGIPGDKGNDLYTGFKPVPGQDHQVTLMWKSDGLPPATPKSASCATAAAR